MTTNRKRRIFAAMVFWGTLLSYIWATPGQYRVAGRRYSDFINFYAAGKIVRSGQGHQLYNLALQTQVQSQFSQGVRMSQHALFYMRPPLEALLFLPLSYLSYARAYEIWVLLSLLLVGATAALLRWRIPEYPSIPWWIYYPAIFSFCPIAFGFGTGQDHALVLFLFALVLIHLYEGHDFRAGCFLGLALIKFQLVLPLVLILLLKRKLRTLAGFSLVATLFLAVGVAVVGWDGMTGYPIYLWRLNRVPAAALIYPSMMPSLRGLVQGWGDPMQSSVGLDLLTGALALALLIWAARQWKTHAACGSQSNLAGISIVLLATLLAGYHAFIYDLSLLFPIVLWAANLGLEDPALDASARCALLLASGALLCAPLPLFLLGKQQVNLLALPVLLLAWGLAQAIRSWQSREDISALAHPATE